MSYWQGPSRWINTLLLIVVGFLAFDALFSLLGANEENGIVSFVGGVAGFFLAPFEGMFGDDQPDILTTLIALLGYALLAGIALAVVRSIEASRHDVEAHRASKERPVSDPSNDRTRRL